MGYPKLFFDNRFADAVPVAQSTASGNYAAANLADMRPYTWWKPASFSNYDQSHAVSVNCGASKAADYALIYGHDLFTNQCQIAFDKSTDNFVSNIVTVALVTPTSDAPFMASFANVSAPYWRFVLLRINQLSYANEFDNAYWVKASVTITPNTATATDGTTTSDTATDADTGNCGSIYRSVTGLDMTRTWRAAIDVLKDGVGMATRFCMLRLDFTGSTTQYYGVKLDTSNGQILNGDLAQLADVAVVDDGTHWRISVAGKTTDPANTTITVRFYPAVGSGTLSSSSNVATTGSAGIWQMRLDVADLPSVAIAIIGAAFVMPKYLSAGFDPKGKTSIQQSNNNDNGQPLGKIIDFKQWKQTLQFANVSWSWLRTFWDAVWESNLSGSPFVFAWDSVNYPAELYLVAAGDNYSTPHQQGGLATLSFDVMGVAK
ncbi:MAG: hypothetical protein Q7S51_04430 [Gallionellaceae bacterium]|nr:hypothetical protein [Gallionellaceae bacterium]